MKNETNKFFNEVISELNDSYRSALLDEMKSNEGEIKNRQHCCMVTVKGYDIYLDFEDEDVPFVMIDHNGAIEQYKNIEDSILSKIDLDKAEDLANDDYAEWERESEELAEQEEELYYWCRL